jgi:uncharacterized protein
VRSTLLRREPERAWILVFETGDPVAETLVSFAKEEGIRGARVEGIGALHDVSLGFYRGDRRDYERFALDEELELLSLLGNLSIADGEPRVHAHVVVGRAGGSALGGHLFEGRVGPTLEAFVTEVPVELRREMAEEVGLPLLRLPS